MKTSNAKHASRLWQASGVLAIVFAVAVAVLIIIPSQPALAQLTSTMDPLLLAPKGLALDPSGNLCLCTNFRGLRVRFPAQRSG